MIKFDKKRLVALRELKGLTQAEFAEKTGTTRQHISAIEAGKNMPGIKMLVRIVNAFDVPVESLFLGKRSEG